MSRIRSEHIINSFMLIVIYAFMAIYFDLRYLLENTVITGGDTASWQGIAQHMLDVLLPAGRLSGWDMGNFAGYPNFQFYFIPPFLLAVLPAYLMHLPLTITLKWAIMSERVMTFTSGLARLMRKIPCCNCRRHLGHAVTIISAPPSRAVRMIRSAILAEISGLTAGNTPPPPQQMA